MLKAKGMSNELIKVHQDKTQESGVKDYFKEDKGSNQPF